MGTMTKPPPIPFRWKGSTFMQTDVINLEQKFNQFAEFWEPKIITRMNELHIKLAKIHGDFVWHSHEETDELFLVIHGKMKIDFRDGKVELSEGELCVVPKGVEHKPFAQDPCDILLIEPKGTMNTGDTGGERTAPQDVWI
jgi:mannose-6-phosphate isomerase-like protein (cupin superfamily)